MSERAQRAKSIFLEAIEKHAPEQWPAFLDGACADDSELRADVEKLLHAQAEIGSFHEESRPRVAETVEGPVSESPGTVIGSYKLIEQIGEGGMGAVWMAQQTEPVKRLVALKLIKAGMDTAQVIARFEAERQALALMDHPNIARVLDGGQTPPAYAGGSPRPYFVMDLVKGVPITTYCDEHHLTPRQRLELFVPVCQAVQHAHQKGIIHRDLKPSNVLVALYDGKPVPKVIDFGVAKATGQSLTEKTLVTGFGNIVGTLEYMSPEQAEVNQLDIDTRSDIYSLGVLLYELLAGSPPFTRKELGKAGLLEMLRVIREEEPSRPSTKLSTAEGLPALATNRGTEPAKLTRLVRGELDWIAMKALEKDRNRRYESANDFALDVQRHLNDEPVLAGPPSVWYRARKFAWRHRRPLLAAVVLVLAMLVALGSLAAAAIRIDRAYGDLKVEKDRTDDALEGERQALEDLRKEQERTRRALNYHRLLLAAREWRNSNIVRTLDLLDDCPDDLRAWEWHYLKRLCDSAQWAVTFDRSAVVDVAVSPDGRRFAIAGGDRTVRIWDTASGKELRAIRFPQFSSRTLYRYVLNLAYSPDGRWLAVANTVIPTQPTRVTLLDAATGDEVRSFETPGRLPVQNLSFSADGTELAAGVSGGRYVIRPTVLPRPQQFSGVIVWDPTTGQPRRKFVTTPAPVGIAFSPDGKKLALLGSDNRVRIVDAATGKDLVACDDASQLPILVRNPANNFEGRIAFSPVGETPRVAAARTDGVITVHDAETGRTVFATHAHEGGARSVSFSPDGKRLVSGGADQTIRIWDAVGGWAVLTIRGHTAEVNAVDFTPDGQSVLSAGQDRTTRLWDAISSQEVQVLRPEGGTCAVGAFSPAGKWLVTRGYQRADPPGPIGIQVWDLNLGRMAFVLEDSRAGSVMAFTPDGRHLLTRDIDRKLKVWDVMARRVVLDPESTEGRPAPGAGATPFGLTPEDAEQLLVRTDAMWGGGGRPLSGNYFCGDGSRFARIKQNEGKVSLHASETGEELFSIPIALQQKGIIGVALDRHGRRIVVNATFPSPDGEHRTQVWDVATGQAQLMQPGANGFLALSPDGKRLVTFTHTATTMYLWDTETGHELLRLSSGGAKVSKLAFSPDGQRLVGQGNGEVYVWDGSPWSDDEGEK